MLLTKRKRSTVVGTPPFIFKELSSFITLSFIFSIDFGLIFNFRISLKIVS